MIKILYLAPHLSTGGMPQFLYKRIESLLKYYNDDVSIQVMEYSFYGSGYIVQRTRLFDLIGEKNIISMGSITDNKSHMKDIISNLEPDIIHIDECVENFSHFNEMPVDIKDFLFNGKWKVVETPHTNLFEYKSKKYHADGYALCSPYQFNESFGECSLDKKALIMYPISDGYRTGEIIDGGSVKNILSVGIWTPNKNQEYIIELANKFYNEYGNDYKFHIIGGQAENFKTYWLPLMGKIPPNVVVYGERYNVGDFYEMCDVVLFPSLSECNPLVIREAISHHKPLVAYNLDAYLGLYDEYITPLKGDVGIDVGNIIDASCGVKYEKVCGDREITFARQNYYFYRKIMGL